MKKGTLILITLLLMVIGYSAYNTTINLYGNSKIAENISDFKVYLSSLKVNGNEVSGINGSKDGFVINTPVTGNIEVEITNDSTEYDTEASLECENSIAESNKSWTFDYTGSEQNFIPPITGTYKIELWGARGGAYFQTANGGYVSGEIDLEQNEKIYVYVGKPGLESVDNDKNLVFNYGYLNYIKTGGGATDIRLINGAWNNNISLASRIMVAGGGGSSGALNPTDGGTPYGGAAGGLVGYQGGSCISGNITEHKGSTGGTQTSGHAFGNVPLLNTGDNYWYNNSGGNGYWSGNFYDWVGLGGHAAVPGTGGGSSYISGHAGCVAITAKSNTSPRYDSHGKLCADGTNDITCSYHYSGKIFKNTKMIDGNGYNWTTSKGSYTGMPSFDGKSTITGNTGNGYARITLLSKTEKIETQGFKILASDKSSHSLSNINVETIKCSLKYSKLSRSKKGSNIQKKWLFSYTGSEQIFIAPEDAVCKLELWGARGGSDFQPARGGYVSGEIDLKKNEKIYVYVGKSGLVSSDSDFVFNYGYQNYTKTGGGATDIRLINGAWNNTSSLASRIMVAGGGGSSGGLNPVDGGSPYGGAAGGLVGYQGGSCISDNITERKGSTGGTQTSGHAFGNIPLLNTGGTYCFNNSGGNGYWSGNFYDWVGIGGHNAVPGTGGGSSYISGHAGCVAISSNSNVSPKKDISGKLCSDGTNDITCSYHYSGKIFKNTKMIDGNGYNWTTNRGSLTGMPSFDGSTSIIGNNNDGYAKITLIDEN